MNLTSKTLAHAQLAVRAAARQFLFDPNIKLIDFGFPLRDGARDESDLAVRIHVREKLSGSALENATEQGRTQMIPATIGGFRTDVPEGNYHLHWRSAWRRTQTNVRAQRVEVMRGGISISDEHHNTYATLGGAVVDRASGEAMLLSNWHVLVGSWWAKRGQRIYQAGRGDGGSYVDTVATLDRDAMASNLDAAVAKLDGSRAIMNEQYGLGKVTGVVAPQLGMSVVKSGRRTGITSGLVTAVEGVAKMRYDNRDRIIRNVVTIEPANGVTEVSAGGDSGSWWLEVNTRAAVGLHFAGSDAPERALANDMSAVLNALNLELMI